MLFFAPKHRINGVKPIRKYIGDYSAKYKDQCWICAGWQEATFSFNIGFAAFSADFHSERQNRSATSGWRAA